MRFQMGIPLRVLIVEDSEDDAQLLLRELRRGGYDVTFALVDTRSAMLAALDEQTWDIVIADFVMPHFSGLAALKALQERGVDLPFIVVSGKIGEDVAVGAIKAGAHDYVLKDNLARLVPAIRWELREAEVRRERGRAEEERIQLVREQAARAEAEAAHRQIASILESITDGFVAVDRDGRFTYVNREAQRLLGRPSEELIGRKAGEEFPEALGSVFEKECRKAISERVTVEFEALYAPLDVWLAVRAYPSEDGLSIYLRDITGRKRAEQFRENYIHVVSHDLRNPLSSIVGHAQMIERAPDKVDQVRRRSQFILTGALRMNVMIQELVDSASIDAGQLCLNAWPLELGPFVSELLERAAGVIDVQRVKVELPPDLPPARADPDRLERILLNLLSNALKYSTSDTEVLLAGKKADGELTVSVTDRGVGIAPDDVPCVFDRFFRGDRAHKAEGLGLGLYITKALVEAHGGRIWVESQPGKGSTFFFTLRLAKPSVGERQSH
ncbi:MAG: response regulator [Chloroflexi bacterium]|nr:response regulator [Chloroflexota bacterium]